VKRQIHRPRRVLCYAFATGISGVLVLAGCASSGGSGSGGSAASGKGASQFSILFTSEDTQTPDELQSLAKDACKSEATAMPISLQQTSDAELQEKDEVLGEANDLPFMYAADNTTIVPGGTYYKTGNVLDIATALSQLGVSDDMTALAESNIKETFDGTTPSVPFQFNVEGIFYNKKIFAEHGITVPTTFTELLADSAKLKAAGVTPITASGNASGWTISRWIGVLLYRELGPNAMEDIENGSAKLTDADYVWAAQQVADMGKDGYFANGITSLTYSQSVDQFLTGGAAMMYNGSWLLAEINSSQNTQGNNIGFMPFPAVAGGKGTIDQYPANTGSPNVINAKLYGTNGKAWLKCIAENYGSASLKDQGTFSGFKVNTPVSNLSPLSQQVQSIISTASTSVLWFEALFDQKANSDAENNAAPLVTGQMSAAQYMSTLQSDQESGT
jgi:raffinose/stachyose/melibiose transport system substrate-binding protein